MKVLLLLLLSPLQGMGASDCRQEDFHFCGDRNQTQNSSVIYEHGPAHISIENTAQALIIRRPFLPNRRNSYYRYSLPPVLGRYRFCIYWFKANRTLSLVYGKQSFLLGGNPSSIITRGKESQKTERTRASIFSVSCISEDGKNTSLVSHSEYFFKASPENMPVWEQDVEEQLTTLDSLITRPPALATGAVEQRMLRHKLGELEKTLAKVELEGQNQTFGKATVHATVLRVQPTRAPRNLAFASQREEGGEVHGFAVDLPGSLFMTVEESEEVMEHRVLLMDINSQTMFQDENSSHILGDKVVGISLVDTVVTNLSDPVVLTFFHDQLLRNVSPLCVFWQENTTGSSGSWDSYGCTTVAAVSRTDCRCNHLTYFAVLMVSSPEITYIHRDYLSIITYIGCLISALAAICTIFFLYFRSKQRDQITSMHIHMNLLGAIFLLDVTFLISEHLASSSSEAVCRAGGLLLHFSLLSCLTWMGIEGYNLYRLVIEVFNAYHDHFLLKLCLVGWGLPFCCVMLIFLASWTNYGPFSIPVYESVGGKSTNATICWITSPLIHNVVNLGFFSLVFLFNSVMLGAMVREILRQNKKGHKLKHVLALFGLSILLGIPWALVFFSFTSGVFRLVSLYIFTIINSLQALLPHRLLQSAGPGLRSGLAGLKVLLLNVSRAVTHDVLITFSPTEGPMTLNMTEKGKAGKIQLPKEIFQTLSSQTERVVVTVLNIHQLGMFKELNQRGQVLDNIVVGITVGEMSISGLQDPVQLTFAHRQLPHNPALDRSTAQALMAVASTGCGVAMAFSIFTIAFCIFLRCRFRSEETLRINLGLHMNLVGSLFLLNLAFLLNSGLSGGTQPATCKVLGGVTHYCLLCCFTWMALEGCHLYLLFVKVLGTYIHHYLLKLCLVGWGFPVLVVGVAGVIGSYGEYCIQTMDHQVIVHLCWITSKYLLVHYITNCGYFGLIFLFNMAVFGVVTQKICCLQDTGTVQGDRNTWKVALVAMGLFCLLGATWALVFLTHGTSSTFMLYLFTILNSLQGIFIFIWLVVLYYPKTKETTGSLIHIIKHNKTTTVSQD
ncbi:Adgrg1 [Columba guinea]|nr:Adgrg1 [Columba guinea]